jgi:bacteriorhodopsin
MLVFGYMGEAGIMAAWPAFIVGCLAWFYMIYELWAGEGKSACNTASPAVQSAYNTMMYIIIIGWAIYPVGYFTGYLMGDGGSALNLNLIYNLADFVNKILFGLIIWHVAVKESSA